MELDGAEIDRILDRHRERFRRLLMQIVAEESGQDPFRVSIDEYRQLSDDERARLVERADALAGDWVDRELAERRAAWLVVVGDRVVAASPDHTHVPSADEVLAMGEREGRVAYLFEAELIEEIARSTSAWSPLAGEDRYPTLPVTLGTASGSVSLEADLDTGSHGTLLDLELAPAEGTAWFRGRHLGKPFSWRAAFVEIGIPTTGGEVRRRLPVRVVRDWAASPFVRLNPARRMLVGRDLLRAFGLRVVLSSIDARSEVLEASPA